jgi:hypothetical protein
MKKLNKMEISALSENLSPIINKIIKEKNERVQTIISDTEKEIIKQNRLMHEIKSLGEKDKSIETYCRYILNNLLGKDKKIIELNKNIKKIVSTNCIKNDIIIYQLESSNLEWIKESIINKYTN